jgi:hypothetical protein
MMRRPTPFLHWHGCRRSRAGAPPARRTATRGIIDGRLSELTLSRKTGDPLEAKPTDCPDSDNSGSLDPGGSASYGRYSTAGCQRAPARSVT